MTPRKVLRFIFWSIAIFCIVVVLLIEGCTMMIGKGAAPAPVRQKSEETKKLEAWTQCHTIVEESLKAPSTASFPWRMNVQVGGGDVYTVDSYVDAQNGFGAMIRTRYFCQLQYDAGADAWRVKEFRVLE